MWHQALTAKAYDHPLGALLSSHESCIPLVRSCDADKPAEQWKWLGFVHGLCGNFLLQTRELEHWRKQRKGKKRKRQKQTDVLGAHLLCSPVEMSHQPSSWWCWGEESGGAKQFRKGRGKTGTALPPDGINHEWALLAIPSLSILPWWRMSEDQFSYLDLNFMKFCLYPPLGSAPNSCWNPRPAQVPFCSVMEGAGYIIRFFIFCPILDMSTGNSWFGELNFQDQWVYWHNQQAVVCSGTAKGARPFCPMSCSHNHSHTVRAPSSAQRQQLTRQHIENPVLVLVFANKGVLKTSMLR